MKKNIYSIAFSFSAAAVMLTGCMFEQEDFFDESAALRIQHTNEKIKDVLCQQTTNGHGWVMQYFVAGTDDYTFEGYNILAGFTPSGKVTMASNHGMLRNGQSGKYTESSSLYEMLAEEGPVLSFNSWNDVLSVFADPVDPSKAPGQIINNGEGMKGDYNLVVMSYSKDEVILRGERYNAITRMIPCDCPWEEYLNKIKTARSVIANSAMPAFYVTDAVDTMYYVGLNKGYPTYCERINDPLTKVVTPVVFTTTGFRLEREKVFNEHPYQEFTITEDSTKLLSEDGSIQVIPCWDTYILNHTAIWEIDETTLSADQKSIFDQIDAEVKKHNASWSLKSVGLGKSTGSESVNGLVFTFYTNNAKTKTNTSGVAFDMNVPGYGQITYKSSADSKVDKNMKTITSKAPDMTDLCLKMAASFNGTFNMKANNNFLPTKAEFSPVGSGNAFKTL